MRVPPAKSSETIFNMGRHTYYFGKFGYRLNPYHARALNGHSGTQTIHVCS